MGEMYAFRLKFMAEAPIHIGSGSGITNVNESLKVNMGRERYMIPSTSWKGVFRSTSTAIARSMEFSQPVIEIVKNHRLRRLNGEMNYHDDDFKCDEVEKLIESHQRDGKLRADRFIIDPAVPTQLAHLFSPDSEPSLEEASKLVKVALNNYSCPIDSLYGSMYFSSWIIFSATVFDGQPEYRAHVAIDRVTFAAKENFYYTEEDIIPQGDIGLKMTLRMPSPENLKFMPCIRIEGKDAVNLLSSTFKFMMNYGVQIGGSKSKGLGLVRLLETSTFLRHSAGSWEPIENFFKI